MFENKIIGILGPTASGKTRLAVLLAHFLDTGIIGVDSRQVYRNMDIGSGKDLGEYHVNGKNIPYYLINIREAGERYTLFDFKKDCLQVISELKEKEKIPLLCGGTGLYFDSILFDYHLPEVEEDLAFRRKLEGMEEQELVKMLTQMKSLHNTTDTLDKSRLIKAIEVARAGQQNKVQESMRFDSIVFGLTGDRKKLKERIEFRLNQRLKEGMVEEVEGLLNMGLSSDDLKYYGLEYKFICSYLCGELNYNDMFQKLRSGIFKFSKKQMTWFRRMEKKGLQIHWLDFERDAMYHLDIMKSVLEKERIVT